MIVYIPSRGRPNKQPTWTNLPQSLRAKCVHVVRDDEWSPYSVLYPRVKQLPPGTEGIGATRQWIIDQHSVKAHGPKILMLDDDITFSARRKDDPTKFRQMEPSDYVEMFRALETSLEEHAHAGLLMREGGNRVTAPYVYCGRQIRVLGYNLGLLKHAKDWPDFTRVDSKEDMDVTLQLLRAGYRNQILCGWVHNQGGSNTSGGCSEYRDEAWNVKASEALHRHHSPFVKVVQKTTKGAWGGGTRTDVIVQWKAAYESSQKVTK